MRQRYFLQCHDELLDNATYITLQDDFMGSGGDVQYIVIKINGTKIGLSGLGVLGYVASPRGVGGAYGVIFNNLISPLYHTTQPEKKLTFFIST